MGKVIDECTHLVHRGNGDGMPETGLWATWETRLRRDSDPNVSVRRRTSREPEGITVLLKPGKAGGGRDPCL